jgi:hypothetical protein
MNGKILLPITRMEMALSGIADSIEHAIHADDGPDYFTLEDGTRLSGSPATCVIKMLRAIQGLALLGLGVKED